MTTKRRTVNPDDIVAINEAYAEIGTYAGAGRATGWSGSTVKRYVIPGYVPKSKREVVEFDKVELPQDNGITAETNWQEILPLSEKEIDELNEIKSIMTV